MILILPALADVNRFTEAPIYFTGRCFKNGFCSVSTIRFSPLKFLQYDILWLSGALDMCFILPALYS